MAEGPDCTFETPMTMGGSSALVLDGAVRLKFIKKHVSNNARGPGEAMDFLREYSVV